jgi:Flp pilus assembly protein TadG
MRLPPDRTPGHHPGLRGEKRRGIAAVELALLLPLLFFLLVGSADFARAFYYGIILDGCARNGALYGRITKGDIPSQYANAQAAVLADASANGLTPAPTVAVGYSPTLGGPYTQTSSVSPGYVQVTVTWTFSTLVEYPGIPSQTTFTRVSVMSIPAGAPVTN